MKNTISGHPLISFFVMAALFSWVAVTPLLLNHALPVEPFQILGAFAGPTLSAVIVIAVMEGKSGMKAFFRRYAQWRAGLVWWLVVLLGILFALNIDATIVLGQSIFPALPIYCVGFSILATWVHNHTGGSILLMILLHSSSNAAVAIRAKVLPADLSGGMRAFVFSGWIPGIMGGIVAILIVILTKGSLAYHKSSGSSPLSLPAVQAMVRKQLYSK